MPNSQPAWQVRIDRAAERAMRRLPKPLLTRIQAAIDRLALDPRPPGCLKLTGSDNLWRIRVGDWRILYAIEDDQLIIVVVEIGPRGDVYR
ncbi:MAG: type II toxin-antitoxin system RelE/ParE family toxin [Desulfurellales bacterium]|nr:MAG: type II toxin-antitoxin system RelE/ParE family toxin [Desulfurellales bacterium]